MISETLLSLTLIVNAMRGQVCAVDFNISCILRLVLRLPGLVIQ